MGAFLSKCNQQLCMHSSHGQTDEPGSSLNYVVCLQGACCWVLCHISFCACASCRGDPIPDRPDGALFLYHVSNGWLPYLLICMLELPLNIIENWFIYSSWGPCGPGWSAYVLATVMHEPHQPCQVCKLSSATCLSIRDVQLSCQNIALVLAGIS